MTMMETGMPEASSNTEATQKLQEAIALHKSHMDGSAPTSPESQQQLMLLLEETLRLLSGESEGAQNEPSQNEMWNQVQRDRAMNNQPGGPMMGQR
jgi:hypothetical protein